MKIAVAVDGSENAVRAAEYALVLAGNMPEAKFEVISVADLDQVQEEQVLLQNAKSLSLTQERIVQPILKMAEKAGVRAEAVLLKGNPSREITIYANGAGLTQLVLGSRGLNAMQEIVIGSVSRNVMEHAECPVTIVK